MQHVIFIDVLVNRSGQDISWSELSYCLRKNDGSILNLCKRKCVKCSVTFNV